jgi:acyl-CoA thioesterase-1
MPLLTMPVIARKFKPAASVSASLSLIRSRARRGLLFCLLLAAALAFGCQSEATRESAPPASNPTATPRAGSSTDGNAAASPVAPANETELPQIVAFGDSLTAGYGLASSQSYPSLLQQRLDEQGYRYRVVNAGISGDTSAGGVRRLDWALQGNVKFLILELGANDGLRGQPVAETKKNLAQIIERAQSRGVKVILAGMEAPPNYGADYTREFRQAFRDLAEQYNVPLIPFFLEGVGGVSRLNQGDGIHPNTEGTKLVVDNVWRVLEPLLKTGPAR